MVIIIQDSYVTKAVGDTSAVTVVKTDPVFDSSFVTGYMQAVIDSDITALTVDNLTTADSTKLLSANQGVVLKALIDGLSTSVVLMGTWDASLGTFPISTYAGESWIVSIGGTVGGVEFTANDRLMAIADGASTTIYAANWHKLDYTDAVLSVAGRTGAVVLTKADVGLGNVDNTSDLDKPISTSAQAALDDKVAKSGDTMTGDLTLNAFLKGTAVTQTSTDTTAGRVLKVGDFGIGKPLFSTTNTVATANQYQKIAEVELVAQYQDAEFSLDLVGISNSQLESMHTILTVRVKQQDPFGTDPSIFVQGLKIGGNKNIDVGYVLEQNTPTTIVSIYVFNKAVYNTIAAFERYCDYRDRLTYTLGTLTTTQPTNYVSGDNVNNYTSGNIVGTVSQSGGIPTGAIIEKGSNANGTYIKYADGTMICSLNIGVSLSPTTSVIQGITVYSASYTWTFPHTFTQILSISANPRLKNVGAGVPALNSAYATDGSVSSTVISLQAIEIFDSISGGGLLAVGKWY